MIKFFLIGWAILIIVLVAFMRGAAGPAPPEAVEGTDEAAAERRGVSGG